MKSLKRIIVPLILLLLSSVVLAQDTALVSRVVDGDTIELSTGEKVRLIGVDTPETVHPSKPIEFFGKEASAFTKSMVEGKRVRLEFDAEERDHYGRLLAYVYLEDGTFLNAEIVRQGYGQILSIPPNVKHADEFLKLQQEARDAGRGLWAGETAPAEPQPAAEVAPGEQAASGNETVYITKTGAKYHRDGCRFLSKSKIPLKLKDAVLRHTPCAVCNPKDFQYFFTPSPSALQISFAPQPSLRLSTRLRPPRSRIRRTLRA